MTPRDFSLAYDAKLARAKVASSRMDDPHSQTTAALNAKALKRDFKAMHRSNKSDWADPAAAIYGLEKDANALLSIGKKFVTAAAPSMSRAGTAAGIAGRNVAGAGKALATGAPMAQNLQTARRVGAAGVRQVGQGLQEGYQAVKPELQQAGQRVRQWASTPGVSKATSAAGAVMPASIQPFAPRPA